MGYTGMGKSAAMMWNVRTGDFVRTITGSLKRRFTTDSTESGRERKGYMDSASSSTPIQSEWIVDEYPAASLDWPESSISVSSEGGTFPMEVTTTSTDG